MDQELHDKIFDDFDDLVDTASIDIGEVRRLLRGHEILTTSGVSVDDAVGLPLDTLEEHRATILQLPTNEKKPYIESLWNSEHRACLSS